MLNVSNLIHHSVTLIWRGGEEKTVARGKGDEIENADQADSISEIKGLSNLIMQTDTNTHERKPPG